MGFSEQIKKRARESAGFRCCACGKFGVQVHHILPRKDGGPDTFENAAALCPNCHGDFGNDPDKRKVITEVRDWWYGRIVAMYSGPGPDINDLEEISDTLDEIKEGQAAALGKLTAILENVATERVRQITADTAATAASDIVNFASFSNAEEWFLTSDEIRGVVASERPATADGVQRFIRTHVDLEAGATFGEVSGTVSRKFKFPKPFADEGVRYAVAIGCLVAITPGELTDDSQLRLA